MVILGDVAGRYITEGTAIEYLLNDCIKIVSVIFLLHLNRRGLITKILNPQIWRFTSQIHKLYMQRIFRIVQIVSGIFNVMGKVGLLIILVCLYPIIAEK